MAAKKGASKRKAPEKLAKWRYIAGLVAFVLGNLMIPLSPVIIALGLPSMYIPGVIVFGEMLIFSTIIFLGKQGFLALKNKIKKLFKRKPIAELKPVGYFRHILGLGLLLIVPFLLHATATAFGYISYSTASFFNPFPDVWGIPSAHQKSFFMLLMFGQEVCIVIGMFLLGGLWWERFRLIFVWPGEKQKN